jgi:flagellar hook-associated protein 2
LESKDEGVKNKLKFSDEIMPVLEKLGFYIKSNEKSEEFSLNDFKANVSNQDIFKNNILSLKKDDFIEISLDNKLKNNDNIKIEFNLKKTEFKIPEAKSLDIDESQVTPQTFEYQDISVNADPIAKDQVIKSEDYPRTPLKLIVIGEKGQKEISLNGDQTDIVLNKNELGIGEIKQIKFENNSVDNYEISNFKVIKEVSTEGFNPKNVVQKAQNAIIEVDGIRVEKSTNKIDDVIKGVTLELKKATDKEIDISIDHDFDYIKDQIIQWVGHYNNVIEFISKETDTDKGPDGKAKGLFAGDLAFMMLHNGLQKITSNYYNTETPFTMLSQLGISTGKPGSTPSEKGGYLEIDEELLDKAIRDNPDKLKSLFGFDSDRDSIPDNGIGVRLYTLLRGMTNLADGTIKQRVEYFNKMIDYNKKSIETMERRLEDYKDQLVYKFSVMEQLVSSLKAQGNYLQSYFNQASQNKNQ